MSGRPGSRPAATFWPAVGPEGAMSVAIVNHTSASGGAVISNETMTKVVPIFVAAMILLIRVLIIGSFSLAGDRMFTTAERSASERNNYARPAQQQTYRPANQGQPILRPASSLNRPVQTTQNQSYRPAPKPAQQTSFMRAEPTYHSVNEPSNDRNYNA